MTHVTSSASSGSVDGCVPAAELVPGDIMVSLAMQGGAWVELLHGKHDL
jgi:hypothetical protein